MSDDPIMTIREAAEYTRRHPQTIRTAVRSRALGCLRTGPRGRMYFRVSQLERWLRGQEQRPSRVAVE